MKNGDNENGDKDTVVADGEDSKGDGEDANDEDRQGASDADGQLDLGELVLED